MGAGVITISIALDEGTDGAAAKAKWFSNTADARTTANRLADLLKSAASGIFPANVAAWVDNSVGTNAYADVVLNGPFLAGTSFKCAGASLDYVSSNPDFNAGQWTDAGGPPADSFVAAVRMGPARGQLGATRLSPTSARVFWKTPGASGNGTPITITGMGIITPMPSLSSGYTSGSDYQVEGQISDNSLLADGDQTTVLGVPLTWRTMGDPALGEITIESTADLSAGSLARTVKNYPVFAGFCEAQSNGAVFQIHVATASRIASLLACSDASGGVTFFSPRPSNGCVNSYVSGTRVSLELGKGGT